MELEYANAPFIMRIFQNPPIRDFVMKWLKGKVIDLTAGYTRLSYEDLITNDIDEKCPTDYHFDAEDILKHFPEKSFDTAIISPPARLAHEFYKVGPTSKLGRIRDVVAKLVKDDGRVIHTGYDSKGMTANRGFTKVALLTVCYVNHLTPDDHILVEDKM